MSYYANEGTYYQNERGIATPALSLAPETGCNER